MKEIVYSSKAKKDIKKIQRKPRCHRLIKFTETPVGHLLHVFAPVEYHFFAECIAGVSTPADTRQIYNIIENIAINSKIKFFKSARFRKALRLQAAWHASATKSQMDAA